MITILTSVVWPLSADDSRESGEEVECKLYILIIIEFLRLYNGSVVLYFTSISTHCYAAQ